MSKKNKNKSITRTLMVVATCIALVGLWAVLATPETALAKKPPREHVLFDVTTLELSDMVILGVANPDLGCPAVKFGPANGRADNKPRVIVNRPSPAIQMDFLAVDDASLCFKKGDIVCDGTLVIGQNDAVYYFRGPGKSGDEPTRYRLDADADIVPDTPGKPFPRGDVGYTVTLSNISVSVDAGPRKNGCEGRFPDACAIVRLERIP